MGQSKKQKAKNRIRQKMLEREPSKARQIRKLMNQLDSLPINSYTGQVEYPKEK